MNRRDIFKIIGGALCAASIELTGMVPRIPKLKVNPAYATAQYEEVLVFHPAIMERLKPAWVNNAHVPIGPRYNFVNGQWIKVEPTLPADG